MHDPALWSRQVWNREVTVAAGVRSRALEINLPELGAYTLSWHVSGLSTECAMVHVISRASTVAIPRTFMAGLNGGNSTTVWGSQRLEIEATNLVAGQTIVELWISPAAPAGEAGQIMRDPYSITTVLADNGAGGAGAWVTATGTAPYPVSPYNGWAPWGCQSFHAIVNSGVGGGTDADGRFVALDGTRIGNFSIGLDNAQGVLRGSKMFHPPHAFLELRNDGSTPSLTCTITWTRGI